jgi:hypothetical protein
MRATRAEVAPLLCSHVHCTSWNLGGDGGASLSCLINDDGQQEGFLFGHIPGAVYRQGPFAPEVDFVARFRVSRYEGNKQATVMNLLRDARVPGVAAAQLLLSNQTSTPAAVSASAIFAAASASSDA